MNYSCLTWAIVSDGEKEKLHVLKYFDMSQEENGRLFSWTDCDINESTTSTEAIERFIHYLDEHPELFIIACSDSLTGNV